MGLLYIDSPSRANPFELKTNAIIEFLFAKICQIFEYKPYRDHAFKVLYKIIYEPRYSFNCIWLIAISFISGKWEVQVIPALNEAFGRERFQIL